MISEILNREETISEWEQIASDYYKIIALSINLSGSLSIILMLWLRETIIGKTSHIFRSVSRSHRSLELNHWRSIEIMHRNLCSLCQQHSTCASDVVFTQKYHSMIIGDNLLFNSVLVHNQLHKSPLALSCLLAENSFAKSMHFYTIDHCS